MDMFTDVDIFHDILNAAMRNVAVYILLDELNVHHFLNMVSNCRVNLQSIQVSEKMIFGLKFSFVVISNSKRGLLSRLGVTENGKSSLKKVCDRFINLYCQVLCFTYELHRLHFYFTSCPLEAKVESFFSVRTSISSDAFVKNRGMSGAM